jgi:hypothetical protein
MAAGDVPQSGRIAGTLAYMAPEQLEGALSARGDLYSLALVLYELLTGERLHDVGDVGELRKAFAVRVPRMRGIPAELEEAIIRCLAVDPANRPASAREVLAAFPGNPLDAAIAAGETPSPELVAAAEQSVPLAPAAAWLALSVALAGLSVIALTKSRVSLEGQTPVRSPAVLTERARSFTTRPAIDSAAWFEKIPGREDLRFQYRQGPLPLISKDPDGRITLDDPPPALGMETVSLTAGGERLPEGGPASERGAPLDSWVYRLLLSPLLVAGLIVARHNTRAGRGDARGARRIAAWVFTCRMLHWLLVAHHVPSLVDESTLIYAALARSLLHAAEVWIGYLAVEPYIRRHRPRTIVSWKRLLEGQWRDSVVGRDVLIGAAFGIVMVLIEIVGRANPGLPPIAAAVPTLASARSAAALLFYFQTRAIFYSLFALFFLLLLRAVVKNRAVASSLWLAVAAVLFANGGYRFLELLLGFVLASLLLRVLNRYGLLASASAVFFYLFLIATPLTLDPSRWTFARSIAVVTLLAAVILWTFRTASAGKERPAL